jgi:hypothetical protein
MFFTNAYHFVLFLQEEYESAKCWKRTSWLGKLTIARICEVDLNRDLLGVSPSLGWACSPEKFTWNLDTRITTMAAHPSQQIIITPILKYESTNINSLNGIPRHRLREHQALDT